MKDLRILIVEDSGRDFDLIVRQLRRAGYEVHSERIETAEEMASALQRGPWDAIVSDNALPSFDAAGALRVLEASGRDIPLIVASGMIGEERAVELMKGGASDYVPKNNLSRLVPVIERELRDAAERRDRRRIQLELDRLRAERETILGQRSALLDINNAVIANLNRQSLCEAILKAVNPSLPCNVVALVLTGADPGSVEITVAELTVGLITAEAESALKGLGGHAVAAGEVVTTVLREEETLSASKQSLWRAGIRSCISGPLLAKSKPFGALILAGEGSEEVTGRDREFFSQMTNQVALAVENMLSYEQIETLKQRLERENAYLIEEINSEHNFEHMVGRSPAFLKLIGDIQRVAPTDATVLITGESGTGKELVARAIHSRSRRSGKPLVKVNCAAISANLVESELFGHVKGAFTGAIDRRIGRFEFAQGGTLFLDEVGELPLEIQAKLLRVLQEHEFEPVGTNRTVRVDVRIIAATNRHLEQAVKEGRFRADLYFRLNVVPIEVPPLRERRGDIPELIRAIVSNYNRKFGRNIQSIADETMLRLMNYDWPGNIRELENLLARAVVLSNGSLLRLGEDILPQIPVVKGMAPPPLSASRAAEPSPHSDDRELNQVERNHILRVLHESNWVIEGPRGAAIALRLHPNTLRSRMKRLHIHRPRAAHG